MTGVTPSTEELSNFHAFREAARQIRHASIIAGGNSVGFEGAIGPSGDFVTRFQLLAEEPFRSLAMSIRLIYMQEERANFYRIYNIIYRLGGPEIKERSRGCRERYKSAVEGSYVRFGLHGDFEGQTAGPKDVFEAWLYGIAFHQDIEHRPLLEELSKYQDGSALPFAVHLIGLRIAGVILDMDDVIADFLGEQRVPRLT